MLHFCVKLARPASSTCNLGLGGGLWGFHRANLDPWLEAALNYTHTHWDTAPPRRFDFIRAEGPFYVYGATNDSFRELVIVLAVRGGVMGRWNRNIGHERRATDTHDVSIQSRV